MKQNLIDQAEFEVKAGNGGNGRVSFLRNKQTRKGGPDGGDGGTGGSIWFEADANISTLRFFAGRDRFRAENGENGGSRNKHGENALDITIKVPVGTLIKTSNEGEIFDLTTDKQRILIAKGGKGGRGNKAFASSENTTPKEAEMGENGQRKLINLELKILADVGLIGLPNVGKSTLLSVLTEAKPEIADYPFTTLAPNLGVMPPFAKASGGVVKSIIIADNPGLIEEAHKGKGLGDEFLKHIERCKVLVHVLAPTMPNAETIPEDLYQNYLTVRKELGQFNPVLLEKPEIVVINKSDLIKDTELRIQDFFQNKGIKAWMISAATHVGLDTLRQEIGRVLVEGK